jgi:hypothetical protein
MFVLKPNRYRNGVIAGTVSDPAEVTGIDGVSPLAILPYFDLIRDHPIDLMHVTKQVVANVVRTIKANDRTRQVFCSKKTFVVSERMLISEELVKYDSKEHICQPRFPMMFKTRHSKSDVAVRYEFGSVNIRFHFNLFSTPTVTPLILCVCRLLFMYLSIMFAADIIRAKTS